MSNTYYGKVIVGELSDAQSLPNAGGADSTNMVGIAGATGGQQWISVYANTAISIATGQAFSIELQGFTSDTAASATSPFSTSNGSGRNHATGTLEDNAHYYLLHKTSADAQLDFAKGDLVAQCAIPEDMFRLLGYDFVQLRYLTDADESSEKVDALVWVKPS